MAKKSIEVKAGARVYYVDIESDRNGERIVRLTEVNTRTGGRYCVYIHAEHFSKVAAALDEAAWEIIKC